MKDFGKKLISAAMALTLAASMSVYAEEASPVESVNGGAMAVMAENAVNGVVGCANHVTFRNDEHFLWGIEGSHDVPGKGTCKTLTYYYGYELICMKCNQTVSTVRTRMIVSHSITHD